MAFQSFDVERTWRRLFWAYLTKVILSVPDEGYTERTWRRLFWAYLTKVILSVTDEGYSKNASCALNLISTFSFTPEIHCKICIFFTNIWGHRKIWQGKFRHWTVLLNPTNDQVIIKVEMPKSLVTGIELKTRKLPHKYTNSHYCCLSWLGTCTSI